MRKTSGTIESSTRRQEVAFNGISGADGSYPFSRTTVAEIAALARGERLDASLLSKAQRWLRERLGLFREGRDGVEESLLEEAGWGVVFSENCDPLIREALGPLIDWRKHQVGALCSKRFKEFWGRDGYAQGESSRSFLERHKADLGAADPDQMPYYLLLVGGPEMIPFDFQYELDLRHAVGRLDFERPEQYASYAESVVTAEKAWFGVSAIGERRAAFFCPQNADSVSSLMRFDLVGSLLDRFARKSEPGWQLDKILDQEATRESLQDLLGGQRKPDFLFTACHGLVFDPPGPLQRDKQGALFCQSRHGADPLEDSVSASDISSDACPHGLIAFHFACYSAGTPQWDDFSRDIKPQQKAPMPFTARLPQRLLAHPSGGALAVIGHVERAWTYSFQGHKTIQINIFEDVIRRILHGAPVGWALELFNFRYAELSAELLSLQRLEEMEPSAGKRDWDFADVYCARKDARNYVVLGDPAVRLASINNGC